MKDKKIVVIGGGTGTAVVLSALKKYPQLKITAIVVVSDDGGSTGRLRDEFGFLPVGDLRQCLAALASGKDQTLIRDILLYRFGESSSLKGHNLGNLILTALEDLVKKRGQGQGQAIEIASKVFRITGQVFPISENSADLVIDYGNKQIIGEKNLDSPKFGGKKIKKISFKKARKIYQPAAEAIAQADLVILGPGDLYASLLANSLATGFKKALKDNQSRGGKFLYNLNLMTHYSQTHQMTALDHLEEVYNYCHRAPDYVLVNHEKIGESILKNYQKQNEWQVKDDLQTKNMPSKFKNCKIVRRKLLSTVKTNVDAAHQHSLLRHDQDKLAQAILEIIY